ncbi:MAG: DUF1840 domain-containing protein [Limnohabitans sp.]|jgi:hypothetical protein|uniref:DUF1840 domain-containing protein n=1 Tax=Limnohabitans sp. TaxID=1907725 RepID=UPI0025D96A17|nr:DUF1840 domain-containing protein [Limnohabitans sp.]MCO4088579.1 DUF1840 domain-containing protein [Limnohabitans sp.]
MLFKFKSQAAPDLIMMAPDARRLLNIMVGDEPERGIIEVAQLSAVIARLERAVVQDELARQQRSDRAQSMQAMSPDGQEDDAETLDSVRLSQRAAPMLKLLKRCQSEICDVVWGV